LLAFGAYANQLQPVMRNMKTTIHCDFFHQWLYAVAAEVFRPTAGLTDQQMLVSG